MDGGTYLEDYLMSLETLPNDVRRDFELVRITNLISVGGRVDFVTQYHDFCHCKIPDPYITLHLVLSSYTDEGSRS